MTTKEAMIECLLRTNKNNGTYWYSRQEFQEFTGKNKSTIQAVILKWRELAQPIHQNALLTCKTFPHPTTKIPTEYFCLTSSPHVELTSLSVTPVGHCKEVLKAIEAKLVANAYNVPPEAIEELREYLAKTNRGVMDILNKHGAYDEPS